MGELFDAIGGLISALGSSPKAEYNRKLVDNQGLADPKPPKYSPQEIRNRNLVCIGARKLGNGKRGKLEFIEEESLYMGTWAISKTGTGKSSFYLATYLYKFISCHETAPNAMIIFDSTNAVRDDVIALCKRYGKPCCVLPQAGINILDTSGGSDDDARALCDAYENYLARSGVKDVFFIGFVQSWIIALFPFLYEVYGEKPHILDIISLASSPQVRKWLIEDARSKGLNEENCSAMFDYMVQFDSKAVKEDSITYNLTGFVSYLRKLIIGKNRSLLCQKQAKTLDQRIAEKEVIIVTSVGFDGSLENLVGHLFLSNIARISNLRDAYKNPHPLWVFIDEMAQLQSKLLADILSGCRKKDLGFFMASQNYGQIDDEYLETILTNARTSIIHSDLPAKTAIPVAESLGEGVYEVRQSTISRNENGGTSRQQSINQEYDLLVRPEELMNIPREEAIIITPHRGAKRTSLHVFKPRLDVPDKQPYSEPKEPLESPLTIWQKQGRYKQAQTPPASPKVKEGEEKFLGPGNSGNNSQKGKDQKRKHPPNNKSQPGNTDPEKREGEMKFLGTENSGNSPQKGNQSREHRSKRSDNDGQAETKEN